MNNLGRNENRNNWIEASPHLRENPFSIPENYFHSLEKDILLHTKIEKNPETIFSTPPDFQEQLTNDIIAKVSEEKLKSILQNDGFSVPHEYFNDLEKTLIQRTSAPPQISRLRTLRKTWMPYVAAASVALAVSMFAWFQQGQSNNIATEQPIVGMHTLATDEIINYLAFYTETGDIIALSDQLPDKSEEFTETLSTEEIELYLRNSI